MKSLLTLLKEKRRFYFPGGTLKREHNADNVVNYSCFRGNLLLTHMKFAGSFQRPFATELLNIFIFNSSF